MGYSFETSMPAYKENPQGKENQKARLLNILNANGGKATLKQLAELIDLPQSTVSGRINDLIDDNKVCASGEIVVFQGRKRKLYSVINHEA